MRGNVDCAEQMKPSCQDITDTDMGEFIWEGGGLQNYGHRLWGTWAQELSSWLWSAGSGARVKPGCLVIPGPHPFQEELSIWHFAQGAWPDFFRGRCTSRGAVGEQGSGYHGGWRLPSTGQFLGIKPGSSFLLSRMGSEWGNPRFAPYLGV